jgi:selenide,water dikinase
MAKASGVTLAIDSKAVPLLPDVLELIGEGMLTRGDKNNRSYVGNTVSIAAGVSPAMQSALFDPQTAGGLLISIPDSAAEELLADIEGATIIGRVVQKGGNLIEVY